jgi:hypothetical protein
MTYTLSERPFIKSVWRMRSGEWLLFSNEANEAKAVSTKTKLERIQNERSPAIQQARGCERGGVKILKRA